jgi:ribosomal protein S18 acetylase RimI-like enzyme
VGRVSGSVELTRSIAIIPYKPQHRDAVLALSLAAWEPVFQNMEPEVPDYVFNAFYPNGWRVRQMADIEAYIDNEAKLIWVASQDEDVVGWIGGRIHAEDSMGEIYILAVSPTCQRQGVARMLMEQVITQMHGQGLAIIMVETGDDSGHAASRATYESIGFERWPVARYFRKL